MSLIRIGGGVLSTAFGSRCQSSLVKRESSKGQIDFRYHLKFVEDRDVLILFIHDPHSVKWCWNFIDVYREYGLKNKVVYVSSAALTFNSFSDDNYELSKAKVEKLLFDHISNLIMFRSPAILYEYSTSRFTRILTYLKRFNIYDVTRSSLPYLTLESFTSTLEYLVKNPNTLPVFEVKGGKKRIHSISRRLFIISQLFLRNEYTFCYSPYVEPEILL